MSYIKKRGLAAIEVALEQNVDFTKALLKLTSGKEFKIKFLSTEHIQQYDAVSVFGKVNTTPVLPGNYYEKAMKLLYQDAKATNDEEVRELAGQLRPKPRFMIAFIDLSTGQPAVIDVSRKQAESLAKTIQKYEKKLDTNAFEISKTGTGTSTIIQLNPIIDIEDLSKEEQKNFKKEYGEMPDEIFEVLPIRDEEGQLEDLRKVGFDVSRLVEAPAPPKPSVFDEFDEFEL